MGKEHHIKGMQDATLAAQRQQEVLDGAIKLYGVAAQAEADRYREMASVALDSILDAKRAYQLNFERLVRSQGD